MKQTRRHHLAMLSATLAAPLIVPGRLAAEATLHEVEMLNNDPENRRETMVFSPPVLRVQPGDTVRFLATDRSHNAQSIDGMTPEGAEPFRGRVNEEIEVTLDVEGTYGYICQPHQTMGMIGFILVGDFTGNLDEVRAAGENLRGRATEQRLEEYLAQIDEIASEEGLA